MSNPEAAEPPEPAVRIGAETVRRMGFGAMQLAGPGVLGPPRRPDEARAVLRRAVELGVDHIDTSQYYGPDVVNDLIRQVLHPYPEDLSIVSKVGARRDEKGAWLPAQRPEELRAGVQDNLRALKTDRLTAVNLRRHDAGHDLPGDQKVPLEDQLAEMTALRDEGLIGGVGLSNVTLDQLDTALAGTDIVCVQNPYNLVDRSAEALLGRCEERGIAFVPFFPLGSAFARTNPVLTHPGVVEVARRAEATPSQVALAWLLARSPVVALIPGTSSLAHLEQNMAAASLALGADDLSLLETV